MPVASGWSDVTRKIVELLGFDSRQFRQVIMLPQGKFREFLMANSQERESILQTLFGTELYKRIEDSLKNAATALARESETVRTQRQTLLDQAGAASEAELETRLQAQKDDLIRLQTEEKAAGTIASQAEKALAEARLVAARFAELDAATQGLQSMAGEQPAWLAKRKQLGLAHQAATIVPYEAAKLEVAQILSARRPERHNCSRTSRRPTRSRPMRMRCWRRPTQGRRRSTGPSDALPNSMLWPPKSPHWANSEHSMRPPSNKRREPDATLRKH